MIIKNHIITTITSYEDFCNTFGVEFDEEWFDEQREEGCSSEDELIYDKLEEMEGNYISIFHMADDGSDYANDVWYIIRVL